MENIKSKLIILAGKIINIKAIARGNCCKKTDGGTGDVSVEAMIASETNDINLAEGEYQIFLDKKTGPVVTNVNLITGVDTLNHANENSAITIDPNSSLTRNTPYSFDVTKTSDYLVKDGSGNVLTNVDVNNIAPVDNGQYTFETKSKVDGGATNVIYFSSNSRR